MVDAEVASQLQTPRPRAAPLAPEMPQVSPSGLHNQLVIEPAGGGSEYLLLASQVRRRP